jgi:polyketide synthase PksN
VLEVEHDIRAEQLVQILQENARVAGRGEQEIRYIGGVREVVRLQEQQPAPQGTRSLPWKDGGVYLITGGAGGLGLIFAQEITTQVSGAHIVLTGRSTLSAKKEAELDALQQQGKGTQVEYRKLDVSDEAAVTVCIEDLISRQGKLDGLIHAAGVIKDNFLIKKTAEEFSAVLAPKVAGTINLDRATAHLPLDCFILFSSVAGALGSVGQGDYALANAFMDRYAAYRNELVREGQRRGRTLSINWPLWAEGGMHVDEATLAQMKRQGLYPLATQPGITALYQAYASDESQVVVVVGEGARIRRQLALQDTTPRLSDRSDVQMKRQESVEGLTAESSADEVGIDTNSLREKMQSALIYLISQQLKVKVEDIDVDAELSEFGFDSISLTAFSNTLNKSYGLELSPTIFFEYPTVAGFAEYLAHEHQGLLAEKFALRTNAKRASGVVARSPEVLQAAGSGRRHRRTSLPSTADQGPEPIAIIGMSGCFPGARDVDAFWENLAKGKDCITEIPKERWDWRAFSGDAGEGSTTSLKWGAFIEGIAEFDPLFFGISPREAELMDPQQRLLMTYTWKAIEDAGYSAQSLSGSQTGIFVGTANSGYSELIGQANIPIEGYSSTGAVSSLGPNRMSYLLNLHGPSEPIETACSSSLVAIHRAVRAIQNGDCEMALVGGINTIITPWGHISFSKAGMLSEDGRCKTFSKAANGYVRGEGVGMLLIKKLAAAERDGDHIYGVIRGSSENHGGRANSLTAPNPKAQAELIKAAYREAKIDPRSVSYIEAHGTGTSLGDPIEINGLKSAFGDLYQDPQLGEGALSGAHCGIGSVKTNIGHLELAAGIAGVIKVLLQLKHKTLVKSLHCEEINPYIQLQDSPFYLLQESQPWTATRMQGHELPRIAGISSFGFGGVNAHVIVEEYVEPQTTVTPSIEITPERPALMVLSAKNEERLKEQVKQLLSHVEAQSLQDNDLANLAYTLQVGREAMEQRLAFSVTTIEQLKEKLGGYLEGKAQRGELEDCYRGEVKKNREALSIFDTDAVLQQAIATWVEQGKYNKLLELWVKGLSFDWSRLYAEGSSYSAVKPRRISLPTYPFARERYWIESSHSGTYESSLTARRQGSDRTSISLVIDSMLAGHVDIETATHKTIALLGKRVNR